MTHPCARTITWAGGTHTFNLATKQAMFRLEGMHSLGEKSIAARLWRMENSAFSLDDVKEILEAGLIGGGSNWSEAHNLICNHVDGNPIAPNALIAHQVIEALFIGPQSNAGTST